MGKIQLEDSRCHSWPTCATFLIQAETSIFLACTTRSLLAVQGSHSTSCVLFPPELEFSVKILKMVLYHPPYNQTWDPLSSLSASELLAPRDLPAPLPGFIDVAMILLGIQVEHKCIENNGNGSTVPQKSKICFKCKIFDLGK